MESKIAFNTYIILILKIQKSFCLLYADYTLCVSPQNTKREKRQLEIKNKILERSGFDEVFHGDEVDGMDSADYNQHQRRCAF